MATTYIEKGENPEVVAPEALTSGEFFVVGALAGVAAKAAESGDGVAMDRTGAWWLPKATGVTYVQGALAYWDVTDKNFNDDTGNNALAIVLEDAASDATEFAGILIPAPMAPAAAAAARLDELEALDQHMPATGTQKAFTVNDTYVPFTEDALTWAADLIEAGDVIDFEFAWKLDGMNAAYLTTFHILLGTREIATVALTTGDALDLASIKGTITFKTVGASSTVDVVYTKTGSDGGVVTTSVVINLNPGAGPATTSAVVLKAEGKAATGSAANLVTQHVGHGELHKMAA